MKAFRALLRPLGSTIALVTMAAAASVVPLERRDVTGALSSLVEHSGVSTASKPLSDLLKHDALSQSLSADHARQLNALQANPLSLPEAHSFMADLHKAYGDAAVAKEGKIQAQIHGLVKPSWNQVLPNRAELARLDGSIAEVKKNAAEHYAMEAQHREAREAMFSELHAADVDYKGGAPLRRGANVPGRLNGVSYPHLTPQEHDVVKQLQASGVDDRYLHQFFSRTSHYRFSNSVHLRDAKVEEFKQLGAKLKTQGPGSAYERRNQPMAIQKLQVGALQDATRANRHSALFLKHHDAALAAPGPFVHPEH